jgi:hypothetical protein
MREQRVPAGSLVGPAAAYGLAGSFEFEQPIIVAVI